MAPLPLLIDTDPGIDDAVAILWALLCPEFSIHAITTVSGNLTADICAANACKILEHLSSQSEARNVPITAGPLKPLARPYPRDPFSHGADGLGELDVPKAEIVKPTGGFAPDVIVETVNTVWEGTKEAGAERGLTILCLGPFTNLALAIQKDPSLPGKIRKVISIAGSFGFGVAGTVRATGDNPVSEWNVYVDPEAADMVFNAGFGSKMVALGLDVTTRIDLDFSEEHRARLSEIAAKGGKRKSEAQFILGVVAFGESKGFPSYCCLIDSVAVAAALDESLVTLEPIRVAVETESRLSLGQTIVDRREHRPWLHLPTIMAASDMDSRRLLDRLVTTIELS